jgi:very-short-patch-repair endonuclease
VRLDQFDALARQHHGVISREMSGLSGQQWRRSIRSGTLVRMYPGVARLVGTADTPEQRIAAAVLTVGHGALASHRSSAYLWGVPRPADDPIDVLVTRREGLRAPSGVNLHRPRDIVHLTPQRQANIRCTNVVRTLCDLGAVDRAGVIEAVGHVLSAKMLTLGTLEVALGVHSRPGRNGITALRDAIDEWAIDTRPADSLLERAMHTLVTRYGLPPVEFHKVIDGWEVDFWVIGTPIVLECDGWATHGLMHKQFERDRERDAELTAAGWIIVRFTYRAVTRTPARTAERIRSVVRRWCPTALMDSTSAR